MVSCAKDRELKSKGDDTTTSCQLE